jgi:dTDP-4-amino-4,6-dideoxygalactose transaminase
MRRLPLVDLAAVHRELGDELEAAVLDVVRHQQFVGGERIAAFEREFAAYLGAEHAIGMANGTDAIELAIKALGIEPGAEILVPANTFIATAEAVAAGGCVPRFVDVDPASGLIDLDSCEQRLSGRTRAVIPVHLYGRMVDMDAVTSFADAHGLTVIEDAAQAHGAHRGGRRAGTIAQIGTFSFYPGKNLGAFGDAGAVVTDDPELAEQMRLLRDHGRRGRHTHVIVGYNSRLDPIQAAVLLVKLRHLERWNERRRAAASWYRDALAPGLIDWCADVPSADVHHVFPIMVAERERVSQALADAGVQTGIHYPVPIPSTPAFAPCADACPAAERRARMQLSLPMHPHLTEDDVRYVARIVGSVLLAQTA